MIISTVLGALLSAAISPSIFGDGFETNLPPLSSDCPVVSTDVGFQPKDYRQETKSWGSVFGTMYPSTPGDFYPIGSWTLAGLRYNPPVSLRGKYISIPFVGSGTPQQFQWNSAKPVYGYQPARFATAVYITITDCMGDLRRTSPFQYTSPDPVRDRSFVTQCRSTNTSEAVMSYGPKSMGALLCPVEAGRTYYINILFENVLDGLNPTTTGCADQVRAACEISAKNRPTQ